VIHNDEKPQLVPLIAAGAVITGDVAFERGVRLQPEVSTAERFGAGEGSCGAAVEPGVAGRTSFTLRVQTGCAEHCSYCIIPSTRGRPRSVAIETVLAEADRVAAAGFKEIAVTGVHLGSFGRDLTPASSLVELLRALASWARGDGRERQPDVVFRISSLEPMDCSRDVLDLVADGGCFAPHFHLPLQHASNAMLAAMRRPYTIEYYAALVDDIRARLPHASIGSDVIVGFPGETNEDFDQLVSYLDSAPLTHVHVFPYSDRPGTAATSMSGKVPGPVIRDRGRRVREVAARLADRFRQSQTGAIRPGLTLEDGSTVVTDNYLKVRIPPGRARNERVRVQIAGQHEGVVVG
jgi:threonylcarbamoyladenosine tRNA methylthiotransferase MtaB